MTQIKEDREEFRQGVSAALTCRINIIGKHWPAEKIDHSNAGISFKSGFGLKPGTVLYIRQEKCLPDCPGEKACDSCRTVMLASVKWCREYEEGGANSYLVGAKYIPNSSGY